MNIEDILSEIDAEISRLQQAKVLLGEGGSPVTVSKKRRGRPPLSASQHVVARPKTKRRMMSAEGRAKIAAAQKARWAKSKKATSTASKKKVGRPAKATGKKAASATKKTAVKSESSAAQA